MRVFLYTVIGIPVLIADAVLLRALPARLASRFTGTQGLILLFGALAYLCLHFLLRKPERMYLWAHEVTHLLVAKLFLRHVHGFHITSRSGGKVVIDRTNVAIDLCPVRGAALQRRRAPSGGAARGGDTPCKEDLPGRGGVPVHDAPLLFRGGVHRRAAGRAAQRKDLLPCRGPAPSDVVDAAPGVAGDSGRIRRPAGFLPAIGSPTGWRRLSGFLRTSARFFRAVSCKLSDMAKTEGMRIRRGDIFLLAILLANLVCGVGLIGALRADLAKDVVEDESALVSSKVSAYLWEKILRFTSAVEQGRRLGESAPVKGDADALTVVADLPAESNFQRIRSGTGEWLPVFMGTPRDLPNRGHVLPLGVLLNGGSKPDQRYAVGAISLADVDGYLGDLRRRGILCRIVDPEGRTLFGVTDGFPVTPRSGIPVRGRGAGDGRGAPKGVVPADVPPGRELPGCRSCRRPSLPYSSSSTWPSSSSCANASSCPRRRRWRRSRKPWRRKARSCRRRPLPGISRGPSTASCRVAASRRKRRSGRSGRASSAGFGRSPNPRRTCCRITGLPRRCSSRVRPTKSSTSSSAGSRKDTAFPGTLIGKVTSDGYLVFHGETDPVSGNPLRIPLWRPDSLLARTFWSGNLLHTSPRELPHLPEEESILNSSPVLCLPVMRTLKVRCVEAKNCADRTCPNYYSENMKCWLKRIPPEFFTGAGDPEIHRETIAECLRCEVFPSAALVVVRSVENGKMVTRENAVPISNLASEAGLALEVVSLYDNMKIMAVTDGLTGLYNHREFYQSLRRELDRARRYRHTLSLLMIDVDDFKQFNDRFGHPAGDFALRMIADLLRKCARTTDIIARYGGEEFAVILPESTPGGSLMVAERIKTEVAGHNFIQNASDPVHLTVSIGIYSSDSGDVSEDQMVSLADEASYAAKKSGKNQVVVKAI